MQMLKTKLLDNLCGILSKAQPKSEKKKPSGEQTSGGSTNIYKVRTTRRTSILGWKATTPMWHNNTDLWPFV